MKTKPKAKQQKYIVETGLGGRVPYAVNGANTTNDLAAYLAKDPHPNHRLVSTQWLNGSYILVWELKEPALIQATLGGGCRFGRNE